MPLSTPACEVPLPDNRHRSVRGQWRDIDPHPQGSAGSSADGSPGLQSDEQVRNRWPSPATELIITLGSADAGPLILLRRKTAISSGKFFLGSTRM
jgi:hypothetical protein